MATDEPDTDREGLPDMLRLPWDRELYEAKPVDLPDEVVGSDCEHCDSGLVDCPTCGHDMACEKCNGLGQSYKPTEVAHGWHLRGAIAAVLIEAKARLYARKDAGVGVQHPWRFEVEGGIDGLVMPALDTADAEGVPTERVNNNG
jgi:hypothetical protein